MSRALWPSVAMIVGGAVSIALWPIFTTLHGPTSFNRDRELLGMDALFWGSMMEAPSGLLIAVGLVGSYRLLTGCGGRLALVGYLLAVAGIAIPAIVNLAILAVMPPLLAPVAGAGLILVAVANRAALTVTRFSRAVLWGLGIALLWSFVWAAAVRPGTIDQIQGYRIYGVVANVLVGAGWILLGAANTTYRYVERPAGWQAESTSPR